LRFEPADYWLWMFILVVQARLHLHHFLCRIPRCLGHCGSTRSATAKVVLALIGGVLFYLADVCSTRSCVLILTRYSKPAVARGLDQCNVGVIYAAGAIVRYPAFGCDIFTAWAVFRRLL